MSDTPLGNNQNQEKNGGRRHGKVEVPKIHQHTFDTATDMDVATSDSLLAEEVSGLLSRNATGLVATSAFSPLVQRRSYPLPAAKSNTSPPNFAGWNFSHVPAQASSRPRIQPKLMVGPANDQYEQEADRMAEQVMRLPTPVQAPGEGGQGAAQRQEEDELAQMKPLLQRQEEDELAQMKPFLQRQEADDLAQMKPQLIQRNSAAGFETDDTFEINLNRQRGGGTPLPAALRADFEPKFGADFSGVRLHTNEQSHRLNQSIQAKAFTTGQDVFFRQAAYEPGSRRGQQLIAHELTHVVQQQHSQGQGVIPQSDGINRVLPTPGERTRNTVAPVVQRRVHQYSEGEQKWVPGETKREGFKAFPAEAQDSLFFNDVTGTSSMEREEVEENLSSLAMKAGTVGADAEPLEAEWDLLGKSLKQTYPTEVTDRSGIQELGEIGFDKTEDWQWTEKEQEEALQDTDATHDAILDFLRKFMGANGQLDYIRNQTWFNKEGDEDRWKIAIDVNYYPNRPIGEFGGSYHKDTGGNNLFVNIIFHNDEPIPATEWFHDVEDEPQEVTDFQKELKPTELSNEIALERKNLPQDNTIRGGVVGKHGYASWVDDLIWHATPMIGTREEAAQAMIDKALNNIEAWEGFWEEATLEDLYEECRIRAEESPDTAGYKMKEEENYDNWTQTEWKEIWETCYANDKELFVSEVADIVPDAWNPDAVVEGERIAEDERIPNSRSIYGEVTGLGRRERENEGESKEAVIAAHEATKEQTRTFIRTWVRVVKV